MCKWSVDQHLAVYVQCTVNNVVSYFLAVQSTPSIQIRSKLSRGHCRQGQVSCRDGNGCIPIYWDCDAYVDCQDRSDEDHCHHASACMLSESVLFLRLSIEILECVSEATGFQKNPKKTTMHAFNSALSFNVSLLFS